MKLVNVEDLKVLVAVESKGEIRYGKLVTDLFDDIPTVEAIPIEWMEKWWRGHFTLADGYDYFMHYLGDMLEDWERENDKSI